MVQIKIEKDERIEEKLDALMEHLGELKEEASELRKQGMDLSMADLKMIDVPSRVNLARKTYAQSDIDAVTKALAQIKNEIDEVKSGTKFDEALKKIEDAYQQIREEKYDEANETYAELKTIYSGLSGDLRKIIFKASLDIHKKLTKR